MLKKAIYLLMGILLMVSVSFAEETPATIQSMTELGEIQKKLDQGITIGKVYYTDGYVPDDLEIVFEPVMTTSPAERAELVQKLSTDVIQAFQAGLLTREQALEELKSRGEELGVYTKV